MVSEVERCCHANSVATNDGWAASIVSWFSRWNENRVKKTRFKKLLSYDDHTLTDVGVSRRKVVKDLGYDPREEQRNYATFTFPQLYLTNNSVITKNHTKHRR